jgi:hypothetical protein
LSKLMFSLPYNAEDKESSQCRSKTDYRRYLFTFGFFFHVVNLFYFDLYRFAGGDESPSFILINR